MGSTVSNPSCVDSKELQDFQHFEPQQIKEWSDSFSKAFPNNLIRPTDLERQLAQFFPFGDVHDFSRTLFRAINASGTGEISFHELLVSFSILSKGNALEKLRWIFRLYDSDCDGFVSKAEMEGVAQSLFDMAGALFDAEYSAKEAVSSIFNELGNESGFLTFDDFKALFMKRPKEFEALTCVECLNDLIDGVLEH